LLEATAKDERRANEIAVRKASRGDNRGRLFCRENLRHATRR